MTMFLSDQGERRIMTILLPVEWGVLGHVRGGGVRQMALCRYLHGRCGDHDEHATGLLLIGAL